MSWTKKGITSIGVLFTIFALTFASVSYVQVGYAVPSTVLVENLQPSWTAIGGGGVYSAYYGPPTPTPYTDVSPGSTALFDGREAGIIKAGFGPFPGNIDNWDEGLFGFKPTTTIDNFAVQPLNYDVENQYGENPVWMTIEIDTGVIGDRSDNDAYQFVPAPYGTGWQAIDAAAGQWQLMDANGNGVGPLMTLSEVAALPANTGRDVVRTYLRLGMGDSYHGSAGLGTVGWVDKVIIGDVTYDFVDTTPPLLSEIIPVPTPTNVNTPDYTFSSTEAGTITYGGSCNSPTTSAVAGSNTITFNALADGTYGDCTILVNDAAGNPSNLLAVTVFTVDTVAPLLTEVTLVITPTNDNTPSYTFNSNEAGTITYTDCSGATTSAVVGDNTVTFGPLSDGIYSTCALTVTDTAGNPSLPLVTSSFTVDTVAPVITINNPDTTPAQFKIITASSSDGILTLSSDSGGVCDVTLTFVAYSDITFTAESDNGKTVCYKAVDTAGNVAYSISNAIGGIDTTAPVITRLGLDPVTVEGGSIYTDAGATALDAVDGDLTSSIVTVNPVNTLIVGPYTVAYDVSDSAGNPATQVTRTVNVVDTTPPVISGMPSDMTAEATSSAGASVSYTLPTATDAVDGIITVSCVPIADSTFALGPTLVTCTATDSSSNTATSTFTITVQDTTAPTITVPIVAPVEATGPGGAVVTYDPPTATDLVDGTDPVVCDKNSGDTFVIGTTTVTCTSTDTHSNVASSPFDVTVQDTITPTTSDIIDGLWHNTDQTVTLTCTDTGSGCAATYYTTDGTNPDTSSLQGTSFVLRNDGTYTIKYFSVDVAGNSEPIRTAANQVKIDKTVPAGTGTTIENIVTGLHADLLDFVDEGTTLDVSNMDSSSGGIVNVEQTSTFSGSGAGIPALGKYISIEASPNIDSAFGEGSVLIKVYYTDAEVAAAGIDESTLRLWYYDTTSTLHVWLPYNAPNGGVDTVANYVWARTTHFSLWGLFGNLIPSPAPSGGGGFVTGACIANFTLTAPASVELTGGSVTVPVTVTKSGTCGGSFAIIATVPTGWTATRGITAMLGTAAPTDTVNIILTAPEDATSDDVSFSLTSSGKTFAASTTVNMPATPTAPAPEAPAPAPAPALPITGAVTGQATADNNLIIGLVVVIVIAALYIIWRMAKKKK